jgi:hypothetical protein
MVPVVSESVAAEKKPVAMFPQESIALALRRNGIPAAWGLDI